MTLQHLHVVMYAPTDTNVALTEQYLADLWNLYSIPSLCAID